MEAQEACAEPYPGVPEEVPITAFETKQPSQPIPEMRFGPVDSSGECTSRGHNVRSRCTHALELEDSGCQAVEKASGEQDSSPVSLQLQQICMRLGMQPGAPHDWSRVYQSPGIAICVHFANSWLASTICIVSLANAAFTYYQYSIPVTTYIITSFMLDAGFWRYGPQYGRQLCYKILSVFCNLGCFSAAMVGFLTPPSDYKYLPFGSFSQYFGLTTVCSFCLGLNSMLGRALEALPQEPFKSLLVPTFKATVLCVRSMDSLTDMTMLRALLDEVRNEILLHRYVDPHTEQLLFSLHVEEERLPLVWQGWEMRRLCRSGSDSDRLRHN
jgi:hypothetical protein